MCRRANTAFKRSAECTGDAARGRRQAFRTSAGRCQNRAASAGASQMLALKCLFVWAGCHFAFYVDGREQQPTRYDLSQLEDSVEDERGVGLLGYLDGRSSRPVPSLTLVTGCLFYSSAALQSAAS